METLEKACSGEIVISCPLSLHQSLTREKFHLIKKKKGWLRRSAKLFALHLQSVRGITN